MWSEGRITWPRAPSGGRCQAPPSLQGQVGRLRAARLVPCLQASGEQHCDAQIPAFVRERVSLQVCSVHAQKQIPGRSASRRADLASPPRGAKSPACPSGPGSLRRRPGRASPPASPARRTVRLGGSRGARRRRKLRAGAAARRVHFDGAEGRHFPCGQTPGEAGGAARPREARCGAGRGGPRCRATGRAPVPNSS